MNRRSLVWGLLFVAAAVATALLPGTATMPQVGVVALLATTGVTLVLVANAEWFLRRTTRGADYRGGCPVGASCLACGAFNLKPRRDCRSCGRALAAGEAAAQKAEAL